MRTDNDLTTKNLLVLWTAASETQRQMASRGTDKPNALTQSEARALSASGCSTKQLAALATLTLSERAAVWPTPEDIEAAASIDAGRGELTAASLIRSKAEEQGISLPPEF